MLPFQLQLGPLDGLKVNLPLGLSGLAFLSLLTSSSIHPCLPLALDQPIGCHWIQNPLWSTAAFQWLFNYYRWSIYWIFKQHSLVGLRSFWDLGLFYSLLTWEIAHSFLATISFLASQEMYKLVGSPVLALELELVPPSSYAQVLQKNLCWITWKLKLQSGLPSLLILPKNFAEWK